MARNSYKHLIAQREMRLDPLSGNTVSTGKDAEKISALYLLKRGDFEWAICWDDLKFPSEHRWQKDEWGIDVVAKHKYGGIWAIQVKDYMQKHVDRVSIAKMKLFVDRAERAGVHYDRMCVVCTEQPANRILRIECKDNDIPIYDRTHLSQYDWPQTMPEALAEYRAHIDEQDPDLLRTKLLQPRKAPKKLWKHQKQCVADLLKHFDAGNERARVYMVTGAGKTIAFAKLADEYDTVVVLVPRLLLAEQTYKKMIEQCEVEFDHVLFVGSKSLGRYDDLDPSQLPTKHTTDPDEIWDFAQQEGRKLIVSTYKSSERIAQAEIYIDLCIFDEAHHVAGFQFENENPRQAQALLNYPFIDHKLFLTATPRVYSSRIKELAHGNGDGNGNANGHFVASLDDEEQFGKLIMNFSYQDAFESYPPIVKPYEIHLAVLTQDEYKQALAQKHIRAADTHRAQLPAHVVAALAQDRIVKKHRLHHGLGFANKIDNATIITQLYERYGSPKDTFVTVISSRQSFEKNNECKYLFDTSKRGFLGNVNSFSEGMDSPCVDYIVFADAMQSKQAIAQKIGRGLRYDKNNPNAKLIVIVPVLLDEDDVPEEGKFNPKKFETILEVLGAMASMDKTLEVEIKEIASNRPSQGRPRRFVIPPNLPLVDIRRLKKVLATAVYSSASVDWWMRFEELKEYLQRHVTYPLQPTLLGRWIGNQRTAYRRGHPCMTPERIATLENLRGWLWNAKDMGHQCHALDDQDLECPNRPRRRCDGVTVCDGHATQWKHGKPYTLLRVRKGLDEAEIQRRANQEGEPHTTLAKEFEVTVTEIGRIARRDDGYVPPRGTRKLTDAGVIKIRQRINVDGELPTEVAEDLGMSVSTICKIANGETWTHVPMVGRYMDRAERMHLELLREVQGYGNVYPRESELGSQTYHQFINLRNKYRDGLVLNEQDFQPEVWKFLTFKKGERISRKDDARSVGSPQWLKRHIHSFGNVCPGPSRMGTAYQLFFTLRTKYRDGLVLNETEFQPKVWEWLNR